MKELLTVLEALEKARHTLAMYVQSGDRNAEVTVAELLKILDNHELNGAWQKVQMSIASPPVAPDAAPVTKVRIEH
jgi:hypothetical protein